MKPLLTVLSIALAQSPIVVDTTTIDRRVLAGLDAQMPSTLYGSSVCFCGDLDGDGASEVAIGSPGDPGCPGVFVVCGKSGQLLHTLWDASSKSRFGEVLCDIGDRDGDGVHDLAVSSSGWEGTGLVEIFSGRSGAMLATYRPEKDEWIFGRALAPVDDLDGDGRAELVVALARYEPDPLLGGYSKVESAPSSLVAIGSHTAARLWTNNFDSSIRGELVRIGDLDGDGLADVACSEGERAVFVSGREGHVLDNSAGPLGRVASPFDICSLARGSGGNEHDFAALQLERSTDNQFSALPQNGAYVMGQSMTLALLHTPRDEAVTAGLADAMRTGAGLVAVRDVDGKRGVVAASAGGDLCWVSLPTGAIQRRTSFPRFDGDQFKIERVQTGGDFDGDGEFDLLVSWSGMDRPTKDRESGWGMDRGVLRRGITIVSGRSGAIAADLSAARYIPGSGR